MWERVEDFLDWIVPAVEVRDELECQIGKQEFARIMNELTYRKVYSVKTKGSGEYVVKVSGRTFGEPSQAKSLFKEARPAWYQSMKSRLRFHLTSAGTIEIISYEHLVGFETEEGAFSAV